MSVIDLNEYRDSLEHNIPTFVECACCGGILFYKTHDGDVCQSCGVEVQLVGGADKSKRADDAYITIAGELKLGGKSVQFENAIEARRALDYITLMHGFHQNKQMLLSAMSIDTEERTLKLLSEFNMPCF